MGEKRSGARPDTPEKRPRRKDQSRSKSESAAASSGPWPIVGIGASAGGLEAVTQLLKQLPASTGMAFVLVQHLDPNHSSELADLLAVHTSMPVSEAADGLTVAPDHFYVIPPNSQMTIRGGVLRLTPRTSNE